jgi:hypothetical protein
MPIWFRIRPGSTSYTNWKAHEAHLSMLRCVRRNGLGMWEDGDEKLVGKGVEEEGAIGSVARCTRR